MAASAAAEAASVNSLPRLHFRDHIWTNTERYLAAEALEEAAEDMINSEGGRAEEDSCAKGMRFVQLLITCAEPEAVACRDKSQASILLYELRANALVFGSSFQRVAYCFVQGLADRLALMQPVGAVGLGPMMTIRVVQESRGAFEFSPAYDSLTFNRSIGYN